MCSLFIDKNTVCKYLTNLCICIQNMQFLQKTVHMVFFFSEYYIIFLTWHHIDNLTNSTEGEGRPSILIDEGKKEKWFGGRVHVSQANPACQPIVQRNANLCRSYYIKSSAAQMHSPPNPSKVLWFIYIGWGSVID